MLRGDNAYPEDYLRKCVTFTIVLGLPVLALLGSTRSSNATDQLCTAYSGLPSEVGDKAGMIFIPGGSFTMGSNRERPEERFTHVVQVDGFWIDQTRGHERRVR